MHSKLFVVAVQARPFHSLVIGDSMTEKNMGCRMSIASHDDFAGFTPTSF
jgi:hypothetical protein